MHAFAPTAVPWQYIVSNCRSGGTQVCYPAHRDGNYRVEQQLAVQTTFGPKTLPPEELNYESML